MLKNLYPSIPDLCYCGCGQIVYGNRKWKRGHNGGMNNLHHSKETKKKISEAQKGEKGYWYGYHHSKEVREKISKKLKGRTYSIETIQRLSENHKGKNNPMYGIKSEFHPNWKGGISNMPYSFDFDKKLKENIRNRDNHICQKCGKIEGNNGQKLTSHHINYDKNNCKIFNLISLCASCNSEVNFNRDYWQEYFTDLLYEKFSLRKHFEGDI